MNANRLWAIGTVIVIGAVIALGWMLGVSPLLAQAAGADEQRAGVEASNLAQEARLAVMRKDFERLDEIQDELDVLRVSVPSEVDSDIVYASLAGLMDGTGLLIDTITTGEAQPYGTGMGAATATETSAESLAADAEAAAREQAARAAEAGEIAQNMGSGGGGGDETAAEPEAVPTPTVTSPSPYLYTVPITITFVDGTPIERVVAFAGGMQNSPRLFIVTSIAATQSADKSQATLTAYMFVMSEPDDSPGSSAGELADEVGKARLPLTPPWGASTASPTPTPTPTGTPAP